MAFDVALSVVCAKGDDTETECVEGATTEQALVDAGAVVLVPGLAQH